MIGAIFEPLMKKGTDVVVRQVGALLKPNTVVVLEVSSKRKVDEIRAIFGDLDHVETRLDDQGRGRCLVLRKSMAGSV